MRRHWEYGVAYVPEPGEPDGHVTPVLDEATALAFIAEHEPLGLMYRRPQPKPWRLMSRINSPRGGSSTQPGRNP